MKPDERRADRRARQKAITRIAARTTGGRASVNRAYKTTNAIAPPMATVRGRANSRAIHQNPTAKIPTWTPEMASKWTVPVVTKGSVRSQSTCSRAPNNKAAAKPA